MENYFGGEGAVNMPLATASSESFTFDAGKPRHKTWRKHACKGKREFNYMATAFTWSERTKNGGAPVLVAIDGLDARFDLGAVVDVCPPNP